jgi:Pilus assembly protein, PilP
MAGNARPQRPKAVAAPAMAGPSTPETASPEGSNPDAFKSENPDLVASRRDPFTPLIDAPRPGGGSGDHLPPGKAGLVIATVRIDGTVKSGNGMIAVLENPEQRVYFVREGDHLYDGDVQRISLDGITFKEDARDAFGKPVERLVTKRIYPSAGEQQ